MKDEYIIINRTALEKEKEELKKIINKYVGYAEKEIYDKIDYLLSQSTPLIPTLEKVWDAAIGFNEAYYNFNENLFSKEEWYQFQKVQKEVQKKVLNKQDYISNLKLDI